MTGTLAPVPTGPRILRGEFCRCETAGGDGNGSRTHSINRSSQATRVQKCSCPSYPETGGPTHSRTANSGDSKSAWQSSSSAVSGFAGLAGSAKSVRASHRRAIPGMPGISMPGIRMLGDHW